MSHVFDDQVAETSTTTGTGDYALAAAVAGNYRRFNAAINRLSGAGIAIGDTLFVVVIDVNPTTLEPTGNGLEAGIYTYSAANTLTRTSIEYSTNANAAVSWAAGTRLVMLSTLSKYLAQFDNERTLPMAAVSVASVTAPAAGILKHFARSRAGRPMPKWIGPSGVDQFLQDAMWDNGGFLYLPNNGTAVGLNNGIAWTSAGTVSHPTPSSTAPARVNQQKRTRWANVVTTTNQVLGLSTAAAEKAMWRGNAAGLGGFLFFARFSIGLWPAATVRLFVGLTDQATNPVTSDTLAGNCCGLWHDTAEAATVLNFVTRNGTTATKAAITLGEALQAGSCFDFMMFCPPNGGTVYYWLWDVKNDAQRVDTSTTTTLPTNTAFMGPAAAMSNGTANTTVTTVAFELARAYGQSDY